MLEFTFILETTKRRLMNNSYIRTDFAHDFLIWTDSLTNKYIHNI